LRLKLTTKYAIITGSVLLATTAMFAIVNIETLKTGAFDEAVRDADNMSETILRTTHYQMLEADRTRLYQMIEEAGSLTGIERIRLFNKEGAINFSTHKREIGAFVDSSSEGCRVCHVNDEDIPPLTEAPTAGRSRVFTDAAGKQYLGMTKGIYNDPSCYMAACHFHSEESKILGILDVIISLESMQVQVATYRNNIFVFTFVMLLILSICLIFFTQKYVSEPIYVLLEHTRRLARGDLSSRVENAPHDEFGELADAFNDMTNNLAVAHSELQEWGNTLEMKIEERTNEICDMQSQLVQSAKLASLGELVAGIAHEINNPLTGILMFSSVVARSPTLDPSLSPDMEMIVSETQRCAKIVRGLLEFSRESIPEKKETSIDQMIDQTLDLVRQQPIFQNVEIVQEYEDKLPLIAVDPDQVRQVLMNIIVNAGQAMEDGGFLKIKAGVTDDRNRIFITLADTGCGIPEENLSKIFDPFYSTKERKGFGLGLSISYGIIQNHGGKIEVSSTLGEGTIFRILLPLMPEVEQ